jgi:transcriptional regulator with XRE-family HTH domain
MLPASKQTNEFYESGFPKKMERKKYDMMINERLKEARSRRGLSLAKAVNELKSRGIMTGVSTIQGYEADEDNINHRYPSLNMLLSLANLYECSLDFIFGVTDDILPPSKDLSVLLSNSNITWRDQEMSEEQRAMLLFKADQIMAL